MFEVENTGSVALTNVVANDPLSGLSSVSPSSAVSLAPGTTATFTMLLIKHILTQVL